MDGFNNGNVNENSVEDIVARYREPVRQLLPYLGWLKENMDKQVAQSYSSENLSTTIPFPVYDSNLLSFVKAAQATDMMDRNWPYVYTRNHINNIKDEHMFIEAAQITDMAELFGIISKYVLSGMTRGSAWAEGVRGGSMYKALEKMRELLRYWGEREL